jgi:hypothetical protein
MFADFRTEPSFQRQQWRLTEHHQNLSFVQTSEFLASMLLEWLKAGEAVRLCVCVCVCVATEMYGCAL